jgi:hypothetical protein
MSLGTNLESVGLFAVLRWCATRSVSGQRVLCLGLYTCSVTCSSARQSSLLQASRECPYLSTVNREVLDFDFERVCSVTLSPLNVYCCLVDGKYFSGTI